MQRIFQILFSLLIISGLAFAQDGAKSQGVNEINTPVNYQPDVSAIFIDDMNGDNTLTGIQSRGWFFDDVDGVGTTTVFQGNPTVFPAYEGPTNGYIGQNFNGAAGGGLLIDQWLISPAVTVQAGDTLKFWHRSPDGSTWPDPLQVWVSSTGGTTSGAFDIQLAAFMSSTTGWQQYVGNFTTSGTVRFAVRYYTTNGGPSGSQSDYVGLDLFEVTQGGGGGGDTYFEDFEGFIAGLQVACQDPTNWTTWSNVPCNNEDALISTNYAFSGTKSVLIDWVAPRYVDLVKPLGAKTTGTWYVDFMAYIPTGKYGYYNILADFAGGASVWAFQAYFNAGGTGTIDAGGQSAATFTFPHNAWFAVQFKVDLDADLAQFWVNNISVYTWQYTLGTFGTPVPKVLDASDIFAPNAVAANNEMYIDDFRFSDTVIPVELTSFIANVNNLGDVVLNWETATEVNNQGFEIERRTETSEFRTIGFVEGYGTTTEPRSYIYTDRTAENGINYYRLKQVDFNGTYEYSDEVEVDVNGPLTFDLAQNYPNPFNPSTSIKYSVPESGNIRLSVFNIVGEEVAVLVNGFSQAGFFEVTFDASNLSTGVYLYKLQSANSVQTKKMMLLK